MPRAVLKNGKISPLEPLPVDWKEGDAVIFDKENNLSDTEPSLNEIEQAFDRLDALCETNDPEDDDRMDRALAEMKRLAKEQARRQMELP